MTKQDVERLFTYHAPRPNSTTAMVEVREAAKHLALTMLRHAPPGIWLENAIGNLHLAVTMANTGIIQEQARVTASADEFLQRRDNYRAADIADDAGKLRAMAAEATRTDVGKVPR